jgi:hypothetical protein
MTLNRTVGYHGREEENFVRLVLFLSGFSLISSPLLVATYAVTRVLHHRRERQKKETD